MFDPAVRREAAAAVKETGGWSRRASAVVGGERRTFDAVEARTAVGSAGFARDISEVAALRAEMERNEDDYSRMIDRLSTAVAIFDKTKRLTLYNAAYRQIWPLEPAFLDQRPTDGEILDLLRAKRQLPEQVDFPAWKAQQLNAYRAIEPSETVWHLPDGRALRVVTSPNPKGGVTYLYDDATQSYALASQVNALTHVQGETLDVLKEGVAAFGADGRMKLFNPAFAELWRIDPAVLRARPHIDEIARACKPLCRKPELFDDLTAMIVDLPDHRESRTARIERTDGLILDCAALPLPDGATLMTSLDVTAGVNVERALTERNQALIAAERLRNDFVNHVSYELRTPLTNIIGFTQLLAGGGVGPLNPKQLEYAGFITNSSSALLAIIDDILDLASIDAGALELRTRGGRRRRGDEGRGGRGPGPVERSGDRIAHRHDRRRRVAHRRRPAGAPGSVQSALQRHQLFGGGPDSYTRGNAARSGDRVQGQRSGTRNSSGSDRSRLRSVRDLSQRLASSRPRTRPFDGQRDGGAASRPGADRYRAQGGHHGHLHFSRGRDGGCGGNAQLAAPSGRQSAQ